MDEIKLEKTLIYTRQLLLVFADIFMLPYAAASKMKMYRIPYQAYENFRLEDRRKFSHEMYRLKKLGYLKIYEKKKVVELTDKGREKLKKYLCEQITIKTSKRWDGKWRVVIFDIPERKKAIREALRHKLIILGFVEIQKSVYIYPFDCLKEINFFRDNYFIKPHVQYMVADRIETEKDLISEFNDRGVFNKNNYLK